MDNCKSPTHKAYKEALEGLYIQTWMASRDLDKLIGDGIDNVGSDALAKGRSLYRNEHKLDEVVERIAFGRSELAKAEAAVNRHFDRGCRNVDAGLKAVGA